MKAITPELKAHLEAGGPYLPATLITLGLVDGRVYRWTDLDVNVTVASVYFPPLGVFDAAWAQQAGTYTWESPAVVAGSPIVMPGIRTRVAVGLAVESCDVELGWAGNPFLLDGKPVPLAAVDGVLDEARVQVERVFLDASATPIPKPLIRFVGQVAAPRIGSSSVTLVCESIVAQLAATQMPRHLFGPTCSNLFSDAQCGYTGGLTTCDRTYDQCVARGRTRSFRGFPLMPRPDTATGL